MGRPFSSAHTFAHTLTTKMITTLVVTIKIVFFHCAKCEFIFGNVECRLSAACRSATLAESSSNKGPGTGPLPEHLTPLRAGER